MRRTSPALPAHEDAPGGSPPDPARLLGDLAGLGVRLSVNGDRLRVEAPRGVLTPELREALRTHKDGLLAALRADRCAAPSSGGSADDGVAPLTHAQERLWLFQELDPGSSTYNITPVVRFQGSLDVDRLRGALARLVERQRALRSILVRTEGGVTQKVVSVPEALLAVEDVTTWPEEEREAAATVLIRRERSRPFDLSREIPFRALLVKRGQDVYDLVTTFHHIQVDGTSLQIFYGELLALYEGRDPGELGTSFVDYARRDREKWSGPLLEEELRFWKDRLEGAPLVLDLPTDRPRPAVQTFRGGQVDRPLDADVLTRLQKLVREEKASLFMAFLAAFAAGLHRESGQRDLVIGTPVTGRSQRGVGNLIGMFVNELPLRVAVPAGTSFRDLLRAARGTAMEGLSHDTLPFALLVEALNPPRDRSRTPIHQVLLNVLPVVEGDGTWEAPGLRLWVPTGRDVQDLLDVQSKYDLTLYALQYGSAVHFTLVYNRDLFTDERAARILRHVEDILRWGTERPDDAMDDVVPLVAPGASSHLRIGGRAVGERPGGGPPAESVPERLRRIATERRDEPALVAADGSTTSYGALLEGVDALSVRLREVVRSESPIGVFTGNDPRAATAVLSVLFGGRPYVPLDPRFPAERLAYMAHDAEVATVLTTRELGPEAASVFGEGTTLVFLDDVPFAGVGALRSPGPDATAYLLYTSGSTGLPKAVVQSHGRLVRQADRYADALGIRPVDRVALLASMSFDAFLMDFFGGLLHGAAVHPVDLRETDVAQLPARAEALGLTVLHMTPTVFRTLAATVRDARFDTVRAVCLGGERARPDDVAFFDDHFPEAAVLLNLYGSSEHSFALGYPVPRDLQRRSTEVPIGWPVGDVEVLLLDERGHPDPVRGEMALRSDHGALGYWNRPDESAQAFVPDPDRPGRTLYRTGDVARRGPDGAYVFLHRADGQLKVRGHRVEPGEVEAVLSAHPQVEEAGVHGQAGREDSEALTACVALRDGVEQSPDAVLRDLALWCRDRLPEYMVPTGWVRVDALPRTPTGKLDRAALPAADGAVAAGPTRTGARNAEEGVLLQIWSDVLQIPAESIGVFDDFFALGGHSLSATQMAARVRDVLEVELPLREIFERPTIAGLAGRLRSTSLARPAFPALLPAADEDEAPLSFSQERMWFLQEMSPEDTAYNLGGATLIEGELDVDRFLAAVDTVARRHEALRTRFVDRRGRPSQVALPEPDHLVLREDLSAEPEETRVDEARGLIGRFLDAPYRLSEDPVLRVAAVKLTERSHAVAVGMHHAVGDQWSFGVLRDEIEAAYLDEGGGSPLPEPPIQYRDYAVWQRRCLAEDVLRTEIEHWRGRLEGVAALDLPTDLPRPPFATSRGDRVWRLLAGDLEESLALLSRNEGVTLFMTLLAGFDALLYAYSGQSDVAVGVPIANRTHLAAERLIGTFVNTLVHRNDLSGDPSFRTLLRRVRATALDAYAHQDAPFELLVKELNPPRDTGRSPLFQVLFNLANDTSKTLRSTGLVSTPLPTGRSSAQFELSMLVSRGRWGTTVQLGYRSDLFTWATAERLLVHYVEILERAVESPDLPLSELVRIPSDDAELLLDTWNRTAEEYPAESSVPALVAEQARRTPARPAVTSSTGSYTYAELVEEARRVTAGLVETGVHPGERVAIIMNRSREMLAALLGILGAGAAYVPVDPAYPAARVRHMIEKSEASAVVTHRSIARTLDLGLPVLDLDEWSPPEPVPFRRTEPDQAAYVIFTSGSTGTPKGVMVPHRAMVNFLTAMAREPGLVAEDTVLALTTISFDIAVLELYLPLVVGARLVIGDEREATDGRLLAARLETEGVTLLQATPATWKLLVAAGWSGKRDLRALCGGEELPPSLASRILDRTAELWNMYGPTETTVWSTIQRIRPGEPILIGRPIANTTVYVLDQDGAPVPVGVPGELWIGGAGVALGYINQPDQTAERFVASPFREGERIYRTGDLVRWRSDGRLEHLGRLDNQVKVRGFRIELGEVEATLRAHPGVRDAVVVARGDRLVGYLVYEPEAPATAELRAWMGERLPLYMMPSFFVGLESFPLTPNGKIDRRGLPDPDISAAAALTHRPPERASECLIASIWTELLEVEGIGTEDNFFELGGHSLLAMEAVAILEERTGQRLDPRWLFFKTLGQLAESIATP